MNSMAILVSEIWPFLPIEELKETPTDKKLLKRDKESLSPNLTLPKTMIELYLTRTFSKK